MDTFSTRLINTTGTARKILRAVSVQGRRVRTLALLACLLAPVFPPVFAEEQLDETTLLKEEVARLRAECQSLRLMLAEPVETPGATNRVAVVVEEKTTETVLLRAECQTLRKLLASPAFIIPPKNEAAAPSPEKPPQADTAKNADWESPEETWQVALPPGFTHWLTTASGVRHNPTCPNHQKTIGRPCAAGEGRACKYCGG